MPPRVADPVLGAVREALSKLDLVHDGMKRLEARMDESVSRQGETEAKLERLQDDHEASVARSGRRMDEVVATSLEGWRKLSDDLTETRATLEKAVDTRLSEMQATLGQEVAAGADRTISTRRLSKEKTAVAAGGAGVVGLGSLVVIIKNLPLILAAPGAVVHYLHQLAQAVVASGAGV